MSEQVVVTELNIDSDGAERGAKTYVDAMARAKAASDDTTESAQASSLALAGVGASMIGVLTGVNSFFDRIRSINKSLADLQAQAKMVGVTLSDLQGLKLGASIAGVGDSDFNSGLQQSAKLLNDASRNSNTLSKELAENGIAIRNANGQMITQNQLLGIAADLIKRARNPGDQSAIAEMLGFTKAWIPLLEQGPAAMSNLTSEAQRAGAVISNETIERAAEFDRQWRKSSAEFSTYMKAAVLDLLPYVDDLIDRAVKLVKTLDKDAIEKAALDQLKAGADMLGLPDDAAVKIEIPQSVIDNWESLGVAVTETAKSLIDFANNDSTWTRISKIWSLLSEGPDFSQMPSKVAGLMPSVSVVPQQDVKWYAGTSPVLDTSDEAMKAGSMASIESVCSMSRPVPLMTGAAPVHPRRGGRWVSAFAVTPS